MAKKFDLERRVDPAPKPAGLSKLLFGLGWDVNKYDGGGEFNLDVSAFLLLENGRVKSDADFVFYNNIRHESGALQSTGNNRSGEGEGDDEQIKVDVSKIPADYRKVVFTVTIHEAEIHKQNFGQTSKSYIRVLDETTGRELFSEDLAEDHSMETGLIAAELSRSGSEWIFNKICSGVQGGLRALCNKYGVSTTVSLSTTATSVPSEAPPPPPPPPPVSAATVIAPSPFAAQKLLLCHESGWDLKIADGDILGRSSGNHAGRLGAFPVISREHAKITRKDGSWYITDLGSSNGSYLGTMQLEPNVPQKLKNNDIVQLANIKFVVRQG
jgi:tellurium resistance protein TerD